MQALKAKTQFCMICNGPATGKHAVGSACSKWLASTAINQICLTPPLWNLQAQLSEFQGLTVILLLPSTAVLAATYCSQYVPYVYVAPAAVAVPCPPGAVVVNPQEFTVGFTQNSCSYT